MLTPERLALRAERRAAALEARIMRRLPEDDRLGDRAPFSGLPWATLREQIRGRIVSAVKRGRGRKRAMRRAQETIACELREAEDRWFVRRKVESTMQLEQLTAQWQREELEAADAALVASVREQRAA